MLQPTAQHPCHRLLCLRSRNQSTPSAPRLRAELPRHEMKKRFQIWGEIIGAEMAA